jgi:hypothetical protein
VYLHPFPRDAIKITQERLRTSVPAWCQPVTRVRVMFCHFGYIAGRKIRRKYG